MASASRRRCSGLALLLAAAGGAAFVSAPAKGRQTGGCARQASSTPEEPWKPLVFKMPKKKPPRVAPPGDDGYSQKMRERLRALQMQDEDPEKKRSVAETKGADLVSVEADNAKVAGLNAMYYMDRINDEAHAEETAPDKAALRKRFARTMERLEQPASGSAAAQRHAEPEQRGRGFLNLGGEDGVDVAQLQRLRAEKARAELAAQHAVAGEEEVGEKSGEVASYLQEQQRRSLAQSRGASKRVPKSPADRKRDYEESKGRINLATLALGLLGSAAAFAASGVDAAFSFGLGSLGALSYLSGLEDYADNAESPIGNATGGRRLLTPVIVVLLVTQWYKIEALSPEVKSLGLHPQLLPALIGFFMYSAGKVLGGVKW